MGRGRPLKTQPLAEAFEQLAQDARLAPPWFWPLIAVLAGCSLLAVQLVGLRAAHTAAPISAEEAP